MADNSSDDNDAAHEWSTAGDATEGVQKPTPKPAIDVVTVALVRDAIGVARGELSDERFAEKYETTAGSSRPHASPSQSDPAPSQSDAMPQRKETTPPPIGSDDISSSTTDADNP